MALENRLTISEINPTWIISFSELHSGSLKKNVSSFDVVYSLYTISYIQFVKHYLF